MRLPLEERANAVRDGGVHPRPERVSSGLDQDHVVGVEAGDGRLLVLLKADDDALEIDRGEIHGDPHKCTHSLKMLKSHERCLKGFDIILGCANSRHTPAT